MSRSLQVMNFTFQDGFDSVYLHSVVMCPMDCAIMVSSRVSAMCYQLQHAHQGFWLSLVEPLCREFIKVYAWARKLLDFQLLGMHKRWQAAQWLNPVLTFDRDGEFNYDTKFKGATRESPLSGDRAEELKKNGFAINHASVKLGSGKNAFLQGKEALQNWG